MVGKRVWGPSPDPAGPGSRPDPEALISSQHASGLSGGQSVSSWTLCQILPTLLHNPRQRGVVPGNMVASRIHLGLLLLSLSFFVSFFFFLCNHSRRKNNLRALVGLVLNLLSKCTCLLVSEWLSEVGEAKRLEKREIFKL